MDIINLDENAVIKWRLTDRCNYACPYCLRKRLAYEKDIDIVGAAVKIRELAEMLRKNCGKMVKIDLIGGEVTILPDLVPAMIELSKSDDIEKINITTNFHKPEEYWVDMVAKVSKPISVTVSYHHTQCKEGMDAFLEKASKVKDLFKFFKVETVATYNATHIDELKKKCDELGIPYMVEEDLTDKRCVGKSCRSSKPKPRYKIIGDDGSETLYGTRNEFMKKHGIDGQAVDTSGMLCSRDYDYLYVERDELWHCTFRETLDNCQIINRMHPCFRKSKRCSLCGNLTLVHDPKAC